MQLQHRLFFQTFSPSLARAPAGLGLGHEGAACSALVGVSLSVVPAYRPAVLAAAAGLVAGTWAKLVADLAARKAPVLVGLAINSTDGAAVVVMASACDFAGLALPFGPLGVALARSITVVPVRFTVGTAHRLVNGAVAEAVVRCLRVLAPAWVVVHRALEVHAIRSA
jgi:hypothetical protein